MYVYVYVCVGQGVVGRAGEDLDCLLLLLLLLLLSVSVMDAMAAHSQAAPPEPYVLIRRPPLLLLRPLPRWQHG